MNTPQPPVLVIGEVLAHIVTAPDGWRREQPGGPPVGTALGLARLDHRVHLATRLGSDQKGRMIRGHLHREGVTLTKGSVHYGWTSTATATSDEQGKVRYDFDIDWSLPASIVDLVRAGRFSHVHTGSLAATLAPGAELVRAALRACRPGATTSYDTNLRPALLGSPEEEQPLIERLVAASDLVKTSDEDLAWLYPGRDPERTAVQWLTLGPALVVLTHGTGGARAYWRNGRLDLAPVAVGRADTLGTSDAFIPGLISGLLGAGLLGDRRSQYGCNSGRAELLAATSAPGLPQRLVDALHVAAHRAAIIRERSGVNPPTTAELAHALE